MKHPARTFGSSFRIRKIRPDKARGEREREASPVFARQSVATTTVNLATIHEGRPLEGGGEGVGPKGEFRA